MLNTNQCLDKLAAMHINFILCGMLPAGHAPGRNISLISPSHQAGVEDVGPEDEDEGPVEEENIDGHVSLACKHGKSTS
jgi:hypothetical protein